MKVQRRKWCQSVGRNLFALFAVALGLVMQGEYNVAIAVEEKQVTHSQDNHVLTNIGVWSPDSRWIYYDIRSELAGSVFDGNRIERVDWLTGRVEIVYESSQNAHCGVVTCNPVDGRAVFIHGPENPTPDWSYSFWHRRGVIVTDAQPDSAKTLDACDIVRPFTPGALRGGSHVHVFSGDGQWVSFTYEDHVLAVGGGKRGLAKNQRNVGVSVPVRQVTVPRTHPRNHDGEMFSVLVTRTTDEPSLGSDEYDRADSDAWVGADGYRRLDGVHQKRAIAFLGNLITKDGERLTELFIVDIPDDVTQPGAEPLQGTESTRPFPPAGTRQRRLTRTAERPYPGIQGVRHWPRSSADGESIAFLMKDDHGVVQLWTISPRGGEPRQVTHNEFDVESAFSWSPDGRSIAFVGNRQVCVVDVPSGETRALTLPADPPPRPEACVFSPNGQSIAYVKSLAGTAGIKNQIFVVEVPH